MSNQGTVRLKVTNSAPAIVKLWNNRYRLEFFCDNNTPKEDWYYENVGAMLPEYGILQDANFGSGVSEDWEAIPSSVYPDMRLVLAEYPYNVRAGTHYVKLTYETLTDSWVEEKAEDADYELNGLKRVSRTFVALPATTYDKVVGTSTINSNGTTLYLGSFKIEKTDAKWSLSEVWLEAGELSREENSEDAKGSISITQIGECPTAPSGYTVVNESKNNTQGFETCSRTFYKNDSELSRSNDYVGSQLAESIEVFSPTGEPTPTNGTAVLGNKSTSNVDGIPTIRYTFLVPSVLSESSDKVGSQLAITIEAFNKTPATPTGYVIANEQTSDVAGIPTNRYTFLKENVELFRSQDKVGSQLAIVIEQFDGTPSTPAEYSLANTQVSDIEGIPTRRYTFLKNSILSTSNDKVGSQLAIVIEAFGEIPTTPANYTLAKTDVSNFEGIKTNRYTFLKPSVLSQIEDKVGSQNAIVIESFGQVPANPGGYSLAKEEVSDVNGIQTKRYTYLKPSTLSKVEIDDGSRQAIIIESFNQTPLGPSGYILTKKETSNFDGIQTKQYTYLKSGILSSSFKSLSDGLIKKSYTWLGTPSAKAGILISEIIGNEQGVQTITREYMNIPNGFSYSGTVPFTIPGTVETKEESNGIVSGNNLIIVTTPPVQTVCVATIDVSYSTNGTPSTSGLYQPRQWSSAIVSGIGYNFAPISYTNTFSNYIRKGSGDTIRGVNVFQSPQALMGQVLEPSAIGRIELEGPTVDPAGGSTFLSISVDPAFISSTGVQYYKIVKVTANVPSRG